jgi:hypothetical protein
VHCSKLRLLLPGETRFASVFIMLKRFVDVKGALVELCSSQAFDRYIKAQKAEVKERGLRAQEAATNRDWWKKLEFILSIFGPITNSLRLADSDIPCAGKMYMQMYNVERELENALKDGAQAFLLKRDIEEVSICVHDVLSSCVCVCVFVWLC